MADLQFHVQTAGTSPANRIAMVIALIQSMPNLRLKHAELAKITHAASTQLGFSIDQALLMIRATHSYNVTYKGIKQNGAYKWSESQYMSRMDNLKESAAANHVPVSHADLQNMMAGNVSMKEANDRFAADNFVRTNADTFNAFNDELKAQGLSPLTKVGDQVNFVLGRASDTFYNVWDQANTRYAATQAGLDIGGNDDTSISYDQMKDITAKNKQQTGGNKSMTDLYKVLGQVLPESQLQGFGLNKDDLVNYEFGGTNQGKITDMITQIASNANAFNTGQSTSKVANLGQRAAQGERA